jgi:hypothetical protein
MSITPLTRIHTRKALVAICLGAMPLVVLAQQASSPTTSDPQTGASATHKGMHKNKKAHTTEMSPDSTGGASNSPNAVGAGHGTTGNNSGGATAPEKGAGGGN